VALVYARHDVIGSLPVGDIFDFSFWTQSLDGSSIDQVHLNAFTAINSAVVATADAYTGGVHFTGVKTHTYDLANFHTSLAVRESALDVAGTSSGDSLPQEVCMVLSLRTDTPGKSGRGRMYLPAIKSSQLTPDGLYQSVVIDEILTAWHDAWVTMTGSDQSTTPVVVSRLHHNAHAVTSMNIGNVPDVQRRRRNRLTESRTTTAFP
jgi:hypothetical protein